ncbi:MAG TPA: VWA-like domain-containing protein [Acidimicrobiales bacterium]|nr:VWA-like domain-containing protein [Acidimicrobiales bacterium]
MIDSQRESTIAAARLWGAARFPYLASALFASNVISEPECGTIAVDREWRIHADPKIVDSLETDEIGKLFVHLIGHLLREHAQRASSVLVTDEDSRAAWNRATDAEINDDLEENDAVPSSAPDLPADLSCPDGQLAETYIENAEPSPRHWDCGSGCDNFDRTWDRPGQSDRTSGRQWDCGIGSQHGQLLRLGVAAEIQRESGQLPGTVPGGWLRWAESVLPSRVDWRRVLAAEIRNGVGSVTGNVDYTYRRPSRRARAAPRVVLPAMHRPVPNVAIVCDTSGSMHEQLLARALSEVEGILTRGGLRQAQVRVLAVDTNVHAVRRVSRASQVTLAGGGGTDMGEGIRAAALLRPRPSVIVVLTDGFTPWPSEPPKGSKVVVGLLSQSTSLPRISNFATPWWARTVYIEDNQLTRST